MLAKRIEATTDDEGLLSVDRADLAITARDGLEAGRYLIC